MEKKVSTIFFTAFILFYGGCETANQKAGIMSREQQKISYANTILGKEKGSDEKELKRLELESQKEIAKIEMQKAVELEKIRAEAKKSEVMSQKEIALKEAMLKEKELDDRRSSNNWYIALSITFFTVVTLLLYRLFREHQRTKLQLHKERMAHEAAMKEKELQTKILEKMLDAVGNGKLTPEQHERLLESISGRQLPRR